MIKIITINTALKTAEQQLTESGFDKNIANIDAAVLLSHILAKPKSYLLTWPEQELSKGQVAMYSALIDRRIKGEPIAYITGQKEFFSLIFTVNEHTLIPRPETELLVETVLDKFKQRSQDKLDILDLGTGSGAIAVALAKTRPHWQVTAVDKSAPALAIAKKNAEQHKAANITFKQSHWADELDKDQKFDCIVSNPPYIAKNDLHLSEGDVRFEPSTALIADHNGLADIDYILNQAPLYLKPNGLLLIEHGFTQLDDIRNIITSMGYYSDFESIQDYANHPRIIVVKNNNSK